MAAMRKNREMLEQLLKQEIVDSVLDMIGNKEPVTMEEVARRCGVAKGTLYNYFRNKEEMLDHVHEVMLAPLRESNRLIFESDHSPLEKLQEFIDMVFDRHESFSNYFQFVWQNRTAEAVLRERIEILYDQLSAVCREGIANGEIIDVDPYILADMIYGTVIGPLTTLPYRNIELSEEMKHKIHQDIKTLINKIVC